MALITLVGLAVQPGRIGVGLIMLATAILVLRLRPRQPFGAGGPPSLADIDGLPQRPGASQSMPLGQGVLVVFARTEYLAARGLRLPALRHDDDDARAVGRALSHGCLWQTQQQAANALTLWAIGLIVGCTLWGYVADKVVGSRKRVVLCGRCRVCPPLATSRHPPGRIPGGVWVAMFWGGFFASTWIPSYAQLKDSVPPQVVATAMGILNLFFWLGGAVYQQVSGLILAVSEAGRTHALAGLSGRVLVVPGIGRAQHHSRLVQQRTTPRGAV